MKKVFSGSMELTKKEGQLFLDQLELLRKKAKTDVNAAAKELFLLFSLVFEEISNTTDLHFTTLFSRIAYIANTYTISSADTRLLHQYRITEETKQTELAVAERIYLGDYLLRLILAKVFALRLDLPEQPQGWKDSQANSFRSVMQGLCFKEGENYIFVDEDNPALELRLDFSEEKKNMHCKTTLDQMWELLEKPVAMNLVEAEIEQEFCFPKGLIIDPDFLVDVTSISESFKPDGKYPHSYWTRRFLPVDKKIPLLLGNVANYFLDEILADPEISFDTLLKQVFQLAPLAYTNKEDADIKKLIQQSKIHYKNIKEVVQVSLPNLGLDISDTYTEPSFLSRKYGMQGRLDVLHSNSEKKQFDIIELKSGSLYRPNVYGLAKNHYTQTLLYDLLIRSAFGYQSKPSNYILYSKVDDKSLRFAPTAKAQQLDALSLRNDIIYFERILEKLEDDAAFKEFIHLLTLQKRIGDNFLMRDLKFIKEQLSRLDKTELEYFRSTISFIAREHRLAKIGEHGIDKTNGLASLWLDSIAEKEENFNILSYLRIEENTSNSENAVIHFVKSEQSNALSRFRVGDIVVLYPCIHALDSPIANQIFKCSILSLDKNGVTVRLRNRQYNQTLFNTHEYWNLEPDHLDSGFNAMYRSLFAWVCLPENYRKKILGLEKPNGTSENNLGFITEGLTDEQNKVFDKILVAKDYFLLWGPPGTGKTSVMIKEYIRYHKEKDKPLLLLAYTNKAVDELCAAVKKAGTDDFIRIGSRYSTGAEYQQNLLSKQVDKLSKRKDLKALLQSTGIYVSTVSAILGKQEIFKLIRFDTILVDEASQILEPMLVSILSKAPKFVLVGDHKQLPAVVVQSSEKSKIKFENLKEKLGTQNLNISLFERLYKKAKAESWTEHFDILTKQGRMHQKLVAFPSRFFYEDFLEVLPGISRLEAAAHLDPSYIWNKRNLFVHAEIDTSLTHKTNEDEADKVISLLKQYLGYYQESNIDLTQSHIGVITPYRAQIALILQKMEEQDLPTHLISVDTVERYQGGARDHIILSMCINRAQQLRTLANLSDEGIDRKFNVAITRARESLCIIGNKEILERNPVYRDWVLGAYEVN